MKFQQTLYDLRSPKRGFTFWGLLGILVIGSIIIWNIHAAWLAHPNDQMLGGGGDGMKNYMTMAWHVKHDSSYVQYRGMNYPYGEHVLFTDCQPALTTAMQWWSKQVSNLGERSVGIMNSFQAISLLIGLGAIFLLLRKLHLPVWYAGLAALGILFLSPQYHRFDGHFGLSHTFVIPLLLYFLCRYEERPSRRYQSLHIGILVWLSAQLHFYYLGVAALFLTLYIGFQIFRDFSRANLYKRISHWVVMLILPFVLLNLWVHWANYAPDRPANPYGFTSYIGYWEGVFLPYESFPLHQWIEKHLVNIREIDFEAKAYVGAAAFLFTLWLLFSGFKMFGKQWEEAAYHRVHKQYLRGICVAALLLLLFSCGFPFAIKGMEWMVDYMGPLRQFRGLGRFTWAFYYVINALMFYSAWNYGIRYHGKWALLLRPIFIGLPLLVVCYEARILQTTRKIPTQSNVARTDVVTSSPDHWLNKVDYKPYQALLPIPYYHLGSENIWLSYNDDHFRRTQVTALYSGVPDMGVNLSRTPISQTINSVQFILEPCEIPAILADLPDNRPLALLVHPPAWEEAQKKYRHLLSKATMVYEHPDLKVLRLELDSIRSYVRAHALEVRNEMDSRTLYPVANSFWQATRPNATIIYKSYDSLNLSGQQFRGRGSFAGNMKDTTTLWKGVLPKGEYTFTCWLRVNVDMGLNNEIKFLEQAPDGRVVHLQHEGMRFYLKTIVNGWGLFEIGFNSREAQPMHLFLQKKGVNAPFWVDEVLIKPVTTEVFHRESGWVARNNFWYRSE